MDYLPPTLCADAYTDALTLGPRFQADHANIQVGADISDTNGVLYQVAQGRPGDWRWIDEREFAAVPQTFKIANIVGVRFRNKVAGQQATVQSFLLGPKDPDVQPGTPFAPIPKVPFALVYDSAGAGVAFPTPGIVVTVPATYAHLLVVFSLQASASTTAELLCQLNGDTNVNNYWPEELFAYGNADSYGAMSHAGNFGSSAGFVLGPLYDQVAGSLWLPNYSNAENYQSVAGNSASRYDNSFVQPRVQLVGGLHSVAAATDQLEFMVNGGGELGGGRVSVYGLGLAG